jgi:hypothetical protein
MKDLKNSDKPLTYLCNFFNIQVKVRGALYLLDLIKGMKGCN